MKPAKTFDANSPQAGFIKLTNMAMLGEFLRTQPVTLTGLRFLLLFTLFPGMIFGFMAGLLITCAVAVTLMVLMYLGHQETAILITRNYLLAGLAVGLLVSLRTLVLAIKRWRMQASYQEAEAQLSPSATRPLSPSGSRRCSLQWEKLENSAHYQAELDLTVTQQGVYVILCQLKSGHWQARPFTHRCTASLCEFAGAEKVAKEAGHPKPKRLSQVQKMYLAPQLLMGFRLQAGTHRIYLRACASKDGSAPSGLALLQNKDEAQ